MADSTPELDAQFVIAVAEVIEEETGGDPNGGLTNDPKDPGGVTRWGISKRSHPTVDVENLSRTDAEALYKAQYWTPLLPYGLEPRLMRLAFECSVNEGLSVTKECLLDAKGRIPFFMAARAMIYAKDKNFAIYGHGWLVRLFTELM